jgi:hypothetical protein
VIVSLCGASTSRRTIGKNESTRKPTHGDRNRDRYISKLIDAYGAARRLVGVQP